MLDLLENKTLQSRYMVKIAFVTLRLSVLQSLNIFQILEPTSSHFLHEVQNTLFRTILVLFII